MSARRLLLTFLVLFNLLTQVLTILILGNASSFSDIFGGDLEGLGDFVFIARSDATLLVTLAATGILANLGLAYLLVRGAIRSERRRQDAPQRPRITGE